jgi:hypothetical protein
MTTASANCRGFSVAVPPEALSGRGEQRIEVPLPLSEEGQVLCLQVQLFAQAEGDLELSLPSRLNTSEIDDTRSVTLPVKPRQLQQLTVALPAYASGGLAALAPSAELIGKASLQSIRIGAMSPIRTPSQASAAPP